MKVFGYTRKKAFNHVDVTHEPETVLTFCNAFQNTPPDSLICIDECAFYVGEQGKVGWAPKGRRLIVKASRTLRRTKYTLVMAISASGIVHHEILDHNCKKVDFIGFIERMNAPTGSTLLMDNIAFHHSKETKNAVALKGWTQLFIPPYSPRVNPIENVFGVIKRKYRSLCTKLISPQSAQQCKEMFEGVLEQIGFLHPYFRHVSVFVAKTILDGGIGFSGYDDGSFVRVIVV